MQATTTILSGSDINLKYYAPKAAFKFFAITNPAQQRRGLNPGNILPDTRVLI
jgi:hypothetical protein